MPRALPKILPSATKTRWTLSKSTESTPVRSSFDVVAVSPEPALLDPPAAAALGEWERERQRQSEDHHSYAMQVPSQQPNGLYFHDDQPLPRYSYDGSQYSSQDDRLSSQGPWKAPANVSRDVSNYSNNYDGFNFDMNGLEDPRQSRRISVNTGVPPQRNIGKQDAVTQHLLYETALMDSQAYEILDMAEVDALKKEHVRVIQKIEATQRKLALESKVRDAAQNLQRLYSTKNRPDTPQDPDSPKKNRHSLLPGRQRSGSRASQSDIEHLQQADNELAGSVKKVDELHGMMKELLERRQEVERKLLRHTAAVLAEEANKQVESAVPGLVNGHHSHMDDEHNEYTPNEFDGIRDILHGKPSGANMNKQHEEQLASMQERLEHLNAQLRNVISEASQTLGRPVGMETALDQGDDSVARVENRFVRLEDSLDALQQQQLEMKSHYTRLQQGNQNMVQQHIEEQMQGLNGQLHNVLLMASEAQPVPGLREPPQPTGQGYQEQLSYLEENLMTMEQLLQNQQQNQSGTAQKLSEYETTISGLWDIIQPDANDRQPSTYDDEDESAPPTPLPEAFSLPAFNSLVQNLHDRATSAKEQHEILRRQVQQQRELNGTFDAEKDREIADWTERHDTVSQEHATLKEEYRALEQELADWMVKHEHTEIKAGEREKELEGVMGELEGMRQVMDRKQAEREEVVKNMQSKLEQLEQQAESHASSQKDMDDLESEVVRLTTELTVVKAELDGAYGSRQERKGAQAAEVEALTEKNRAASDQVGQLERELAEMTTEFQELTKESIELEKEREQLDALIDGLRDRCDALETQLSDEKLRWVGMKSPTGGLEGGVREGTSMMVLRQEFKKMMRDQRAEGIKLLKSEQEERRRLEGELRKMRQANGPLKRLETASGSATPT